LINLVLMLSLPGRETIGGLMLIELPHRLGHRRRCSTTSLHDPFGIDQRTLRDAGKPYLGLGPRRPERLRSVVQQIDQCGCGFRMRTLTVSEVRF
jgi:hypothetical protein